VADERLDAALASRGLARSRTVAAKLVSDGMVSVDGEWIVKPSFRVTPGADIRVAPTDSYVSRGAHKLLGALAAFPGVAVAGAHALDVGASTGGFTQVLLERGAASVVALDVGHGQLVPELRAHPAVVVVEGVNVRELTAERLAAESGRAEPPTVVVGDLSFISLTLVLPPLVSAVGLGADYVLLVKPQFEVGRGGIREGIVRSADLRADAVSRVLWAAWDLGLGTAGVTASPIVGGAGNHEYLIRLNAALGGNPTEWLERINDMVRVERA